MNATLDSILAFLFVLLMVVTVVASIAASKKGYVRPWRLLLVAIGLVSSLVICLWMYKYVLDGSMLLSWYLLVSVTVTVLYVVIVAWIYPRWMGKYFPPSEGK